jgi:ketosteroid isomerase-like protein
MLVSLHQDLVVRPYPGWPEAEIVGRDAYARVLTDMHDGFERTRFDLRDVIDINDDRVLVEAEWRGTPRGGGSEIHAFGVGVFELQEGRVIHAAFFRDRDQALEAARPSE